MDSMGSGILVESRGSGFRSIFSSDVFIFSEALWPSQFECVCCLLDEVVLRSISWFILEGHLGLVFCCSLNS